MITTPPPRRPAEEDEDTFVVDRKEAAATRWAPEPDGVPTRAEVSAAHPALVGAVLSPNRPDEGDVVRFRARHGATRPPLRADPRASRKGSERLGILDERGVLLGIGLGATACLYAVAALVPPAPPEPGEAPVETPVVATIAPSKLPSAPMESVAGTSAPAPTPPAVPPPMAPRVSSGTAAVTRAPGGPSGPTDTVTHLERGWALLAAHPEAALAHFELAAQRPEHAIPARWGKAQALFRLGEDAEHARIVCGLQAGEGVIAAQARHTVSRLRLDCP
ncbi:MAG: hypothetical protein H6732_08865 [Alphaproteobacteria bacterium]|nr:hypothetical protein [Alphaproteobacteria bacterium]